MEMTVGFQCFDENGNIILDATYRVMRIVNSVYLDGSVPNGSLPPNDILKQGGWVSFQPDNTCGDGYLSGGVITPRFSIDQNTGILSWSYAPKNSAQYDVYQRGTLFYGAS
jgi:hypothetical protein